MKNILITLVALLLASPAFAGSAQTFEYGPQNDIMLMRSQNTTIGTTAFCVDFIEDVTGSIAGEACGNDDVNEIVWPQNAQVHYVVVRQTIASDASDVCDVELEVGGTEVAAASVAMAATALSRTKTALEYNLHDGDAVGISFNTGTSCMTGTTPEVIVELWGYWVDDSSF